MNIHIETERLIFRDIEETDVEGMFALDSDTEVHRYLGNKPVKSFDETRQVIKYIRQQYVDNGIGRWAVIDKSTDAFMGWGGFKLEDVVRSDFNYIDLGYRLRRKYWGKGIGTEIAKESLKHGFNTLNFAEICAAADVQNIGSNKILSQSGMKFTETFEFEGVKHNWYRIKKIEWLELE